MALVLFGSFISFVMTAPPLIAPSYPPYDGQAGDTYTAYFLAILSFALAGAWPHLKNWYKDDTQRLYHPLAEHFRSLGMLGSMLWGMFSVPFVICIVPEEASPTILVFSIAAILMGPIIAFVSVVACVLLRWDLVRETAST